MSLLPSMTPQGASLIEAAYASGGDPATLLVLADFLEDTDTYPDAAHVYRWLAYRKKWPLMAANGRSAAWFCLPRGRPRKWEWPHEIPASVFHVLIMGTGEKRRRDLGSMEFAGPMAAVVNLGAALDVLRRDWEARPT